MALTNLQRKTLYYERVIREAEKSSHAPEYQAFCNALKGLMEFSKKLDKPGTKMTPEDYKNLKNNYREVQTACSTYLNSGKEFSEFEKNRKGIIEDISSVLDSDIKVLETLDPKEPGTLSEVIAKSRSYTIVLKKNDLNKVGANLSSRIPLRKNDGTKGFFTPKAVFNNDKEWAAAIDKYIEKVKERGWFTEQTEKRLNAIKNGKKLAETFCSVCPGKPIEEYQKGPGMKQRAEDAIIDVAWVLGLSNEKDYETVDADIKAKFKADKTLKKDVIDFIGAMASMVNYRGIMQQTGIKKDANISSRNCAMSDIAELLGYNNLVAKSTPMKVMIDGELVEGVFMETVEGTDLCNIKPNDPVLDARKGSFESPEALRQITDLQVLDFICGNTDRHLGNMIYQFKKDSYGNSHLMSIKGIDNDCAFGTPEIKEGQPILKMTNPEDMQFITESMFAKLRSMNKETIQMKLKGYKAEGDLSEAEIDAVWDRLEKVRAAVPSKITVIPDNYWAKNSFLNAKVKNENYLGRVKAMSRLCDRSMYNDDVKDYKRISYNRDRRVSNKVLFDPDKMKAIEELRKQMDDAKALFYDSDEYSVMQNGFERVEGITKYIQEKYKKPEDIPGNEAALLEDAYMDLAENAYKYMNLKKLVPFQTRGQKRVKLATALMKFANETIDAMDKNPEMEQEAAKEELENTEPEM